MPSKLVNIKIDPNTKTHVIETWAGKDGEPSAKRLPFNSPDEAKAYYERMKGRLVEE